MWYITEMGMIGYGQQSGAIGPLSNPALLPRFPLGGIYVGEEAFRDKIRSLPMPVEFPVIEPLVSVTKPPLNLHFTGDTNPSRLTCYGPGGLMPISEMTDTHIIATALDDIDVGRTKYNCTMPSQQRGRFHWFSQLWIRMQDDGSWYPEP